VNHSVVTSDGSAFKRELNIESQSFFNPNSIVINNLAVLNNCIVASFVITGNGELFTGEDVDCVEGGFGEGFVFNRDELNNDFAFVQVLVENVLSNIGGSSYINESNLLVNLTCRNSFVLLVTCNVVCSSTVKLKGRKNGVGFLTVCIVVVSLGVISDFGSCKNSVSIFELVLSSTVDIDELTLNFNCGRIRSLVGFDICNELIVVSTSSSYIEGVT
jgi:hypothetical protein